MDTDGNGKLSVKEFGALMTALDKPISEDKLKDFMEQSFGSTDVDFPAFLAYYIKFPDTLDSDHDGFDSVDTDGSGDISEAEFIKLMESLGLFTDRERRLVFAMADEDGNQVLSFEEYEGIQQGSK